MKWDWPMIMANIILIILLFAAVQYTNQLRSEGNKCMRNPLVYGAAAYEKASGSPFQGTGTFLNGKYASFIFTPDGILSQLSSLGGTNPNYTIPNLTGLLK